MKASEFRTKTLDELNGLTQSKKSELARLRFKQSMGQLEKTAELRKMRQDIARLQTVAKEKETSKGKHGKAN
jgi:large subunit ribosomal protein L29